MNIKKETLIGFIFGSLAVTVTSFSIIYSKYLKVTMRMSRNEAYLSESEAWKKKYSHYTNDTPKDLQDQAIAELQEIMRRYNI